MSTNTKITLPFGCNKGLPNGVEIAWGARLIAPADLVWDRQGCAGGEEGGPERAELLEWMNGGSMNEAREFCRLHGIGTPFSSIADSRSEDVIQLYSDGQGRIYGSPQGSHGYVYVCAYLYKHMKTSE
jgi:hypothetical protein